MVWSVDRSKRVLRVLVVNCLPTCYLGLLSDLSLCPQVHCFYDCIKDDEETGNLAINEFASALSYENTE